MAGYPGKPSILAFDDSGTLLATSGADVALVWSFRGDGPEGTSPGVLDLHSAPIKALAFARRGLRLASGCRRGVVGVWSLQDDGDGELAGAADVEELISQLYWRPDGRALAALDSRGGVTSWRVSA